MNRRELSVAIVAGAAGVASAARAQTGIGSAVAAPPTGMDARAQAFYASFNDQLASVPADQRDDIRRLYEMNGWRPLWTPALQQAAVAAVNLAPRHGLDPREYLDLRAVTADPQRSDMRLTSATLKYARVLSRGRVAPQTVEDLWELDRNADDLVPGFSTALGNGKLSDWLESLTPQDIGYRNLAAGYLRYRDIAQRGGWPAFTAGPAIRPGMSDGRLPAIKARLVAEGDLSAAEAAQASDTIYDAVLQAGMQKFQTRHGLLNDGVVGAGSQTALTARAEDRARQIALNLERRRWLERDLAPERIEVNTAACIMVYWKDGQPVHSNRVVCGQPDKQTPSLEKPFASVLANPPWNVPAGIAASEILPKGPGYLRAANMYVTADGRVVQRAGPGSALGYVKFELQDSYAIFLHDTPSKGAFRLAYRHRSHGCVRVENAVDFARLLLSPDPAKLAEFDGAQASHETKRITTGRNIKVRLLYWTAFVTGSGAVAFREDVYRRDQRLAEALGIAVNLPRPVDDGRQNPADVGP